MYLGRKGVKQSISALLVPRHVIRRVVIHVGEEHTVLMAIGRVPRKPVWLPAQSVLLEPMDTVVSYLTSRQRMVGIGLDEISTAKLRFVVRVVATNNKTRCHL